MLSLHIQNLYIVRFYSVHTLFDSILTEPIHCRCMEFFPFPGNCSKYGNKLKLPILEPQSCEHFMFAAWMKKLFACMNICLKMCNYHKLLSIKDICRNIQNFAYPSRHDQHCPKEHQMDLKVFVLIDYLMSIIRKTPIHELLNSVMNS